MFEASFPVADLVEGEWDYRVTAKLHGMSEKDIEISLAGDTLTVKGEKKEEREESRQPVRRRAALRLVPALVPAARGRRSGEDRGRLQEWRAHDHAAEATGGAGQAPEDRGQGQLKLAAWPFHVEGLAAPGIPFQRRCLRGVAEEVLGGC